MYPSSSAPAHIYGTPRMNKLSSSDSLPKLCPTASSIGTFNYNLTHFLVITLAKMLFLLFLRLRMQIFPEDVLFPTM